MHGLWWREDISINKPLVEPSCPCKCALLQFEGKEYSVMEAGWDFWGGAVGVNPLTPNLGVWKL